MARPSSKAPYFITLIKKSFASDPVAANRIAGLLIAEIVASFSDKAIEVSLVRCMPETKNGSLRYCSSIEDISSSF